MLRPRLRKGLQTGVLQVQYLKGKGNIYRMGIDIGSTTVKVVLADAENGIVFSRYRRHFPKLKKRSRIF